MNYNYFFDLTPIGVIEQLICSDWLEDSEQEILANCLRFGYKICNYTNKSENYGFGNGYVRGRGLYNNINISYDNEQYYSGNGFGNGADITILCYLGAGRGDGFGFGGDLNKYYLL